MNYNILYYLLLITVLYGLWSLWKKNKSIRYENIDIFCDNCKTQIDSVIEDQEVFEYTCKKCNYKGIIKKQSLEF